MADFIRYQYDLYRYTPSDINEHMETLYAYAKECGSIMELGVRDCISTWAFAAGLLDNQQTTKKLMLVDIKEANIVPLIKNGGTLIDIKTFWDSDLNMQLTENYDMVFIDTWHVYAQLKRELGKFAPHVNKYIVMHDTTSDEEYGEAIRYNHNIGNLSETSGFPSEEIAKGLWPAVEEFLEQNPEWIIHERFYNNNGLTILKKIC